jgi:hypothetical protein
LGALVAVNGGCFVTSNVDGYQGVPSGLADQGKLESQSSGARAALVLGKGGDARIENLTSTVTVRAGEATHAVEGINRKPGVVWDCGRPGLRPTVLPRQDFTCTTADELVPFTAEFGADLPAGPGTQVVLDHSGKVTAVGVRGGKVPAGGSVVQGIGASAEWLTAHASIGGRLALDEQIRDTSGARVFLQGSDSIVGAAPVLLRNGRQAIDAATEGVLDPKDLSPMPGASSASRARWPASTRGAACCSSPRRPPARRKRRDHTRRRRSADAESGRGGRDHLDGGGSSAMAVNGALVNHPSNSTGERPIGDAILVR